MVKTNYPNDFEKMWKLIKNTESYGLGAVGPKAKAYDQYRKFRNQNPSHEDFEMLMDNIRKQARYKYQTRKLGEFVENFPHVFRYLRDGRFNDELVQDPDQEEKKLLDQEISQETAQKKVADLTDRDWAKGYYNY